MSTATASVWLTQALHVRQIDNEGSNTDDTGWGNAAM
jgi:hypothetical protein